MYTSRYLIRILARFCLLFLFVIVTSLVTTSKTTAQSFATPILPSTTNTAPPLSSATPSLVQRMELLELQVEDLSKKKDNPQKDVWDKVNSVSGLFSGILIAIIGGVATYVYRERERESEKSRNKEQLAILQVQTIQGFMPQLQSGNEKAIEAALLAITAIGNMELTTSLAKLYRGTGTISALEKIAESPDRTAAQQAKSSLAVFNAESEMRIAHLMRLFKGQEIPGNLFGVDGKITLPVFVKVNVTDGPEDMGIDIHAQSTNEEWLVQVKIKLSSTRIINVALNDLVTLRHIYPNAKIWFAVMDDLNPKQLDHISYVTKRQNIFLSSISEVEQIEDILNR